MEGGGRVTTDILKREKKISVGRKQWVQGETGSEWGRGMRRKEGVRLGRVQQRLIDSQE